MRCVMAFSFYFDDSLRLRVWKEGAPPADARVWRPPLPPEMLTMEVI